MGGGLGWSFFFSTVLETNTVNKVKEKWEGWVYITALQRTSISFPLPSESPNPTLMFELLANVQRETETLTQSNISQRYLSMR